MSADAPRLRRGEGSSGVSNLELFYDLVFVFAITQVSHHLIEHLDWEGAGQTAMLLLAIWWSWNYTTWATNELDPDANRVRALIIAVMLGSLVMAVALPYAFEDRALLFAVTYVLIQFGRTGFLAFVGVDAGSDERRRATSILIWFAAAGGFWVAGAVAEHGARTVLWLVALAIDYAAPLLTFRLPGRKTEHAAWNVDPEHMAERFQLFVIIALGESVVITGATTSGLELSLGRALALCVAFLGTVALWWLYFRAVAGRAGAQLAGAEADRTLIARDVYTYLHVVLVAGIVLSAVGDELVIAHPGEELPARELLPIAGGPAIYLLGQFLMRLRAGHGVSPTRLGGIAGCVAAGLVGTQLPGLAAGALVLAVLVGVVAASELQRTSRSDPVATS